MGLAGVLAKAPNHPTIGLLLLLFIFVPCPWACWLPFLPCWSVGFVTSFIGLPRPNYYTFTSCCAYGPVGCHSCHVSSLGLLPLSLGFPSPIVLLLPLVVPIGLLAVILAMLAHWACYLFPWASLAQLLYFYLFYLFFVPSFLIVGLLLLLSLLQKMDINKVFELCYSKSNVETLILESSSYQFSSCKQRYSMALL